LGRDWNDSTRRRRTPLDWIGFSHRLRNDHNDDDDDDDDIDNGDDDDDDEEEEEEEEEGKIQFSSV
jgi:hypothetical protein